MIFVNSRGVKMKYKVTDLIESDHGCEGLAPGEEPAVTLILRDESGNISRVRVDDKIALEKNWDVGAEIDSAEIEKYRML